MPPLSTIKNRTQIDSDRAKNVMAAWLAGLAMTTAELAYLGFLRDQNMVDQLASAPAVTA
ncbi:hypothetical protein [Mesorhizobium sp. ANAO-SY3R2]|uniref:hypothetical protein n=1 Tax=Mesorhizobium sp. ANAO-SY3R2 TaxID=3166644 RepID=UPI003670FAC3